MNLIKDSAWKSLEEVNNVNIYLYMNLNILTYCFVGYFCLFFPLIYSFIVFIWSHKDTCFARFIFA